MKKLILTASLSLLITGAYAQKIKEASVPQAVKDGFKKHFPTAKVEKWEKEDGNFEAKFDVNKVESSALLDVNGKLLETESEIAVSALPKAVTEYLAKNEPGKKVKEAAKIVDAAGKITYEAEIDKADLLFDEKGTFIKKVVETKKEEKDEKK